MVLNILASATLLAHHINPDAPASTPQPAINQSCQMGPASWYGPGFHGRQTASGETFNQDALTAAHRTLPFGTMVTVTNQNNGRTVVVRINDRGPFTGGRIIDLSYAAAGALDARQDGVVPSHICW